jgi:hypothetical protein
LQLSLSIRAGQNSGDAVGIDLGSVFTGNNIQLLMGAIPTSKDFIHQGVLENSKDGQNWSSLAKGDNERKSKLTF